MKLEEIVRGVSLDGIEPTSVVTVSAAEMIGADSLQLVYKLPSGDLRERLLTVEISAEFPNGASEQIKRAATENATALGFKSKVWES